MASFPHIYAQLEAGVEVDGWESVQWGREVDSDCYFVDLVRGPEHMRVLISSKALLLCGDSIPIEEYIRRLLGIRRLTSFKPLPTPFRADEKGAKAPSTVSNDYERSHKHRS